MPHLALLATAFLAMGSKQAADAPAQLFAEHQTVADLTRLAITPQLDGVIASEEWDPFYESANFHSYFQWEPHKLHLAAVAPLGQEVVFSFDLKNNGWLVGRDNLEVRIRRTDTGTQVQGRVLDADNRLGPKWIDMPGIATAARTGSTASTEAGTWTAEVTLQDPGTNFISEDPRVIGMRADLIPMEGQSPAYFPRVLNQVRLGYKRVTGLPGGVFWEPQGERTYVTPGNKLKIRYTFKGDNSAGFERASMRSEGLAKDFTSSHEIPFPHFDKKNRAFVDYDTDVTSEAPLGYRVAQCVITSKDGATAVGQAGYRICNDLDLELVPVDRNRSAGPSLNKLTVYLRSNTRDKMTGNLKVTLPAGFTVLTGNDKTFTLYSRGTARRVLEMSIPSGAVGTFPVQISAKVGSRDFNETAYMTIQY